MQTKIFRTVARRLAGLTLIACCALPAFAQDPPPPTPQPTTTPTPQPINQTPDQQPVARPIPARTIGLESGKVVRWTLRDAITAALDKNVDIELERENVRLMQYDLIAAQGFYDPSISVATLYNRSAIPNTFRFSGAESTAVTRDSISVNGGLTKNFERYGTVLDTTFNNARQGSNTNNLAVQYAPSLGFQLTQPLWRNFRIDRNRQLIQVTRRRLDLSDAVFRQRVIEIISQVQQAYWDLALAIQNEGIARESVKLAETQLNNNKRQVEVGTLAPIDVVSAATQVESRRQQVFQAINQVALAENQLKSLTVESPSDELWNSRIEPVESFDIKPVALPLGDALRLAQENRPEVKQFGLQKDINKIDVSFFRDQSKPQIDFVAGYTTNGLAGSPGVFPNTTTNCSNPVLLNNPGPNEDPTRPYCIPTSVTRLADGRIVPVTGDPILFERRTVTLPANVADQFQGGLFGALGNLFKNEFRTISFGINIGIPLRNRTAKANLGRALEVGRQLDLQERRLLQNIEVEVRNAVQSVETSQLRIDAARAARQYAQQQLEGEEKRFAAGLSNTFLVLTRQNEVSQAQYTELQALADYNKSVATLQRVASITLSSNNVEIKADTPVTIK